MKTINFENNYLQDRNKKYAYKKPFFINLLGVLFYVVLFVFICNIIFNLIFIKAQVVGISMIPTYNKNLDATTVYNNSYYENSPYKDVVYANKFEKGSNGDIVLLNLNNELVIKRIIAKENQKVTLKLGNGYSDFTNYYYYIDDVLLDESYIYSREDMDFSYFYRFCYGNANRNFDVNIISPNIEAEFVVNENEVFVLGDNRLVSGDSVRFGTVSIDNIYGKVVFSYEYNQNFFSYIWQKICSIF